MANQDRLRTKRLRLQLAVVLSSLLAFGVANVVSSGSSSAAVTAVKGDAYGYFSNIGLFGGMPQKCGIPPTLPCPNPEVMLPPAGSASPITATVPSVDLVYGPAHIFDSGLITVSTQGTPGPNGSVTSSTDIQPCVAAVSNGCNAGEIYAGPLSAKSMTSTCSTDRTTGAVTGSTTIGTGVLRDTGSPGGTQTVANPPVVNATYTGTNPDTGKVYKWVFNEQTVNSDGSLTVTAGHEYLQAGASGAQGDLLIGTVTCGVTGTPDTTTTAGATTTVAATTTTTSTTVAPTTTTTVAATTTTVAATTTTTRPATTTTTVAATTTTTRPATTTTTVAATTTTRPATTTTTVAPPTTTTIAPPNSNICQILRILLAVFPGLARVIVPLLTLLGCLR